MIQGSRIDTFDRSTILESPKSKSSFQTEKESQNSAYTKMIDSRPIRSRKKRDELQRKYPSLHARTPHYLITGTNTRRKSALVKNNNQVDLCLQNNHNNDAENSNNKDAWIKPLLQNEEELREVENLLLSTANYGIGNNNNNSINNSIKQQQRNSIIRQVRYHSRILEPLQKPAMSNRIQDYLSVEKIDLLKVIKLQPKSNNVNNGNKYKSCNEDNFRKTESCISSKILTDEELLLIPPSPTKHLPKKNIKFKIPFETYNYRDFIWKINYSNGIMIETPTEYTFKIKYFVGKGNNSNLVKGILSRRTWLTCTDKIHEANFVWTQIKSPEYMVLLPESSNNLILLTNNNLNYNKNITTNKSIGECNNVYNNTITTKLNFLNQKEHDEFSLFWFENINKENRCKESFNHRTKLFETNRNVFRVEELITRVNNHLEYNYIIGNKKAMFRTMKDYYESSGIQTFDALPLTFHIKEGLNDPEYLKFLQNYYAYAKIIKKEGKGSNVWIVKPGENTNRGNGITVCLTLDHIKSILKCNEKHYDGTTKTYIVQKYIENPLLYKRRKFDLRHYMMICSQNGVIKGYWYQKGYVRTTSSEYSLKSDTGSIHLTNDAVQKNLPDYGKFEKGNKLTYEELNAYLKKHDHKFDFWQLIYPKMKRIATDMIRASALSLDPKRKMNSFEVFGLDFMIDSFYGVRLIECNTNPCLETSCPVLTEIIPKMLEDTFEIVLDPIYPPPTTLNVTPKNAHIFYSNPSETNLYELVYDCRLESPHFINNEMFETHGINAEDDDFYDDDGEDWKD